MFKFEFPSEKALEDYVWSQIADQSHCPIADDSVHFAYRQMPIPGYGVTDIVKVSVFPQRTDITVLELKNEPLKESHLSQVARYMRGLERWSERYQQIFPNHQINITGELAGPLKPDSNDLVYMSGQLEAISIFDVGVSMEHGFHSEIVGDGWFQRDENLKGGKDLARVAFEFWKKQKAAFESFDSLEFPMEGI